jgi:hypothetical protein
VRFAVHGPGIPAASPRSHGVPRRDVLCRVHVSVAEAPHTPAFSLRQTGNAHQFAGRERCAVVYPAVDAYDLIVAWRWDGIGNRGEGYMPAPSSITCHPVGLHLLRHLPGPAEPYPACLRDADLADVAGQAAHVPLPPAPAHNTKSLVPASLSPRRPSCSVLRIKGRGHRQSEVPQRLLLYHLGARAQPLMRGAGSGKLPTLLQITGSALAARVPVRMLLDRQIPNEPGVGAVVSQHCLLGGRGKQAVPGHTNTVATNTVIPGR